MKKFIILIFLLVYTYNIAYSQFQPILYGTTQAGGDDLQGTIFSIPSGSTTATVQFSFRKTHGSTPKHTHLIETATGKFYGLASYGGSNNNGVLFEYDAVSDIYTKKIDFVSTTTGNEPNGSLLQASNGKLYGTTAYGGAFNYGVIFEYNLSTNILTKKIDFNVGPGGQSPTGNLIEAPNGKLYGMTRTGGANGVGTLYEYDPSVNVYIKKIDFNGVGNGSWGSGSLLKASNGKLYGCTRQGGVNNLGVIFEYDISTNILTKKYDFSTVNGAEPFGGAMIEATNGKLYGLTSIGGVNNFGVIFEYNIALNSYTKIFDFNGAVSGKIPYGSLMQHSNGKLYGLTYSGGVNDYGAMFQFEIGTSIYTKLLDFNGVQNGRNPQGSIMMGTNSKLYGMATIGGPVNDGVLFDYDVATSTFTKRVNFNNWSNGSFVFGSLTNYTNNIIYGQTSSGGAYDGGTLYSFNAVSNQFIKKINFDINNMGSNPKGPMLSYTNSLFYGVAGAGGTFSLGTIFEYNPVTNVLVKKIDFSGVANGSYPESSLVAAGNGLLYGVTGNGGVNNDGVIYEYNPGANILTKKFDFTSSTSGSYPISRMHLATNGKFYGVTQYGGTNNMGVLYEYNYVANTYSVLVNFAGVTNGSYPGGELIEAPNGKLYGLTSSGGVNAQGTIFEFDYSTNTFTKKQDFVNSTTTPWQPKNIGFKLSSNGKLYAATHYGGSSSLGTVIEYNYNANILIKKEDFVVTNGQQPSYTGCLIELAICPTVGGTISLNSNVSCFGGSNGSVTMNAIGGTNFTYSWMPSGGTNSVATGLGVGNYTCLATNGCGNNITKTISITQPPALTLTASSNTAIVCPGSSAILSSTVMGGTSPITYSWSTGQTNSTIAPNSTVNTVYTLTVTDNNSCIKTETLFIQTYPSQSLALNSGAVCNGSSFLLNATGSFVSYTYCCGGPLVVPSSITIFTVQSTDVNGCIATAVNNVTILPLPSLNILCNKSLICPGESATLTASGALSYTWQNNSNGNTLIVSPTTSTTYTVVGTGLNGCTGNANHFLYVSICTVLEEEGIGSSFICLPNPFSDQISLKFSSGTALPIRIEVLDLLGRVILTREINKNETDFNLTDIERGIYIIKAIDKNGKYSTLKIMKL